MTRSRASKLAWSPAAHDLHYDRQEDPMNKVPVSNGDPPTTQFLPNYSTRQVLPTLKVNITLFSLNPPVHSVNSYVPSTRQDQWLVATRLDVQIASISIITESSTGQHETRRSDYRKKSTGDLESSALQKPIMLAQ